MSFTLLLDLDDTLLDTNVQTFVPAYFQALAKHLRSWVKPEVMLAALMSGTQLMLANQDPGHTLQEVFDQDFYPRLGTPKQELSAAIEDFYDNVFRQLRSVTRQRPGARELVDWAQAQGYRVVVATDPLFPRKAVYERIRWAGLEPERFDLISSYETFHFTKSHPEYYAELLGRLGWPDGAVLMVGNDEQRDLARAQELGLMTYQVDAAPAAVGVAATQPARPTRVVGHGTLVELRTWLESVEPAMLEPSLRSRRATEAILAATPAVLQSLTAGLTEQAWKHEPGPDDWSILEIVCHLRDTEREVHKLQLEALQQQERQPFVPRPDAAVWAKQRKYLNENGPAAIAGLLAARMDTLRDLSEVSAETWEKPARHAIFGPTHFGEVVGFMADHDRLHIQQAWETLRAAG
jgi:FMN phosphatase YigB (HAD superfamily)